MENIYMPILDHCNEMEVMHRGISDQLLLFKTISSDYSESQKSLLQKTGFQIIQSICSVLKNFNIDISESNKVYFDYLIEFGEIKPELICTNNLLLVLVKMLKKNKEFLFNEKYREKL